MLNLTFIDTFQHKIKLHSISIDNFELIWKVIIQVNGLMDVRPYNDMLGLCLWVHLKSKATFRKNVLTPEISAKVRRGIVRHSPHLPGKTDC